MRSLVHTDSFAQGKLIPGCSSPAEDSSKRSVARDVARCSSVVVLLLVVSSCTSPPPRLQEARLPTDAVPDPIAAPTHSVTAPTVEAAPTQPLWFAGGGPGSVHSQSGMVVSVEANATRAGVLMLEQGGNAVDAAVAVGYALAVTHPTAGNLGGGGFALIKARGELTVALDFRERAPAKSTPAAFRSMLRRDAVGPMASGVPGSVAGLNAAHERFGRLSRARVLAPAIELSKGHVLAERQAKTIEWAWRHLRTDPDGRRIFGRSEREGGGPKRAGDRLEQPELTQTLLRISEHGDAGFYEGETALAIERLMMASGGLITRDDLREFRAVFREPLSIDYRDVHVEVMSPPSAGGVAVIEMLAMLERLDAARFPPNSLAGYHLLAEVAKRAHADRRFRVVDPDSVEQYDAEARLQRYRNADTWLGPFPIDMEQATPTPTLHPLYSEAKKELEHTTHFSVVDADGMVVSCTTTLSRGFGARYVVPTVGVVMNNSFAAFGGVGEDVPKPGRRMTSSMSPTIVSYQGEPVLLLGSPGGDTIPNTVVQVLRGVVDYGLPLSEAIDAPRVHHGFVPNEIRYEASRPVSAETRRGLVRLGHALSAPTSAMGDANNILLWGEHSFGYADPREGGLAMAPSALAELAATESSPAQVAVDDQEP